MTTSDRRVRMGRCACSRCGGGREDLSDCNHSKQGSPTSHRLVPRHRLLSTSKWVQNDQTRENYRYPVYVHVIHKFTPDVFLACAVKKQLARQIHGPCLPSSPAECGERLLRGPTETKSPGLQISPPVYTVPVIMTRLVAMCARNNSIELSNFR